jgi:glycerol-3-phosphate dehydrogenase (NAD(P)+)
MTITVIGAGAWGTAIAKLIAENGNDCLIYARENEVVNSINSKNENELFFKGISLPKNLKATSNLKDVVNSDYFFLVPPAQFLRSTLEDFKKFNIKMTSKFIICSKGIENTSLKLMSEVLDDVIGHSDFCVMSGPSFAHEVANKEVTIVTIASMDNQLADEVKSIMQTPYFKLQYTDDVISPQIAGAIKNVIAIACGIAKGLKQEENTKAAIITKGYNEIRNLCIALGGKSDALREPAGIGDLFLTCNSEKSRNFTFGYELATNSLKQNNISVIEGVATSISVKQMNKKYNVPLPLCQKINDVIEGRAEAKEILEIL